MKREGRQHGMVRSNQILPPPWNPKSGRRLVNQLDSPPTAGLFTKVSRKPTNHSKFTSRCGRPRCAGCHDHPACKSKDKAKGAHKLRSSDVVSNHRLVSWRVVDSKPGSGYSGFSATGVLDNLANDGSSYIVYHDDGDFVEDNGTMGVSEIGFGDGEDQMTYVDEDEDEDEGWCLVREM